jgi:hypothetical protein
MIACAASFRMEKGLAQPNLLFDAYAVAEINDAYS